MSEKKGPFDAARRILSDYADYGVGTIGEVKGRSCEAAIRVLEAAGKVDKKTCLDEMDDCYYSKSLNPWGTEARILGEIRALLEALPEKEER